MSNEHAMVKCAARALVKLAQENEGLKVKIAQLECKERALAVAHRLAESGTIEHSQILEKAASLAKEDLNVIEKALDLNLNTILNIGSASMSKEANIVDKPDAKTATKNFAEFIISNYS